MVAASYLIHYDTLLQNVAAILSQNATKIDYDVLQVLYNKCDRIITKCDSYYKLRRYKYKSLFLTKI